jgi:hypothetical protein
MGYGLGKNSPIVLTQSRTNFEALIDRHGQYVRWRSARKCPCTREDTGQPDVHCEKCGGSGDIYDYQKSYKDTLQAKVRGNIIELPAENINAEVLKVYDAKGNDFQFTKTGAFIQITGGARLPSQNEIVSLLIRESVVKHFESVPLEKIDGGFYRVPGVETTDGAAAAVKGFRQNLIRVDSDAGVLTAYGVDYMLPNQFIILSQNLNKADEQLVNAHNGNAVCTFPYMFDVSENDVITVLSGAMTAKALITKKSGSADDVIPEFFVDGVVSLETKSGEYHEGSDFVLTGTNRIHWLGEIRPSDGEYMSLVYRYYPTYRIAKNIPNLRTSEDQRIPCKVILRFFGAFSESRGVNRNG